MNTRSEQRTHEWWKDRSDNMQAAVVSEVFAARQKDSYAAGWRRNAMFAFVVVGCMCLLKMISAVA